MAPVGRHTERHEHHRRRDRGSRPDGQHGLPSGRGRRRPRVGRRFDLGDGLGELAGADVAVEFSTPDATLANVLHCIRRGVHAVVGTTGWSEDKLDRVRWALDTSPGTGVLIAPNFSLGAVLMMRFAAQAARFYESAEVVELHHPDKVDAPSGTAARTARLIAEKRKDSGLPPIPTPRRRRWRAPAELTSTA